MVDLNAVLETRFDSDAGEGLSIREYLKALLVTLWKEGEGFSGKRPFGNSGWEFELYSPLIKSGAVPGRLDEDGYIAEVDEVAASKVVLALIDAIFAPAQ